MSMKRWQDWLNVLLGIWLFLSPWILRFAHDIQNDNWDFYAVGIAIVVFAGTALYMHALWGEYVSLALGIWMAVSPWALKFDTQLMATRDAVAVGLIVAILAIWAMVRDTWGGRGSAHVH